MYYIHLFGRFDESGRRGSEIMYTCIQKKNKYEWNELKANIGYDNK